MPLIRSPLVIALVVFAGCSDAGRKLEGSIGVVEVIETPPPIAVVETPPVLPLPSGEVQPLVPQFIYLEPLPLPPRHVVRASAAPTAMRQIGLVQSIEVDVDVEGGVLGARQISAVFVSPQGLVWERQGSVIEAKAGQTQVAHFSLPVASTFIEDQHLTGTWQIITLDDGVEQASATFALEE